MVGVKNQKDPRDSLHHGGWMMKVICWCLLVIFMFFLPNEIVSFYGKPNFTFSIYSFQQVKLTSFMFAAESTSKFGSGLFLLVQVVLLLDFVHSWNDTWVGYDEQFWLVLFVFTFHKQLKFNSSLIFIQFFFNYKPCDGCRYTALLVVSLVCYVATFSFSGLLFYLFTPSGQECGLNTFFIVMTLILVFVFAIITLHPTVSKRVLLL